MLVHSPSMRSRSSLRLLAVVALASGCATRVATRDVPRPVIAPIGDALISGADTAYVLGGPWFRVLSSSRVGLRDAAPALRSTARSFYEMFGDAPAPIGVVLVDRATPNALRILASPPSGLATVTLLQTGAGRGAHHRSMAPNVSLGAAEAWVSLYSAQWAGALRTEPARPDDDTSGRVPDERVDVPDWLRVAAVHMLADPSSGDESTRWMRAHMDAAMPIARLFAYRVADDRDLRALLQPAAEGAAPAAGAAGANARFVAQATSLLQYLRATQGSAIAGELIPPLLDGYDMSEILDRLPVATTADALDASWRRWVLANDGPVRDGSARVAVR